MNLSNLLIWIGTGKLTWAVFEEIQYISIWKKVINNLLTLASEQRITENSFRHIGPVIKIVMHLTNYVL